MTRLRIVKTKQELKHRAFSCAARPHDGNGLPGLNFQTEIVERLLQRARGVVERKTGKLHRAASGWHGGH